MDGIRILLGAIPFSERMEYHSVHSAPDSRMNGMNGIQFTRNRQNTRSSGKFFGGKSNAAVMFSHLCFWTHERVRRRGSSKVTSAMSIPFS